LLSYRCAEYRHYAIPLLSLCLFFHEPAHHDRRSEHAKQNGGYQAIEAQENTIAITLLVDSNPSPSEHCSDERFPRLRGIHAAPRGHIQRCLFAKTPIV